MLARVCPALNFYPRPPRGGRPARPRRAGRCAYISIHALREEGDCLPCKCWTQCSTFLSTPSARRATTLAGAEIHATRSFLSTPSARRATRYCPPDNPECSYFYPRPPRGGRLDHIHRALNNMAFLSTPSARRATFMPLQTRRFERYFYPRPPRGGRLWTMTPSLILRRYFYPRPPRGGRPDCPADRDPDICIFLSTPSARRATFQFLKLRVYYNHFYPRPPRGGRPLSQQAAPVERSISIHALREEGDRPSCWVVTMTVNFYPRPPRGGRRPPGSCYNAIGGFLSTPSARRATAGASPPPPAQNNFYPRPPRGGRLAGASPPPPAQNISIHALREEGDAQTWAQQSTGYTFLSTPSARRATYTS